MRRKRKAIDFRLDIAPVNLIDLLLVLLIFFVTTTSFLKLQVIELTLPNADASQQIKSKSEDYSISIDLTCKTYLNAKAVTLEVLQEELMSLKATSPKALFRVGADAASPHECFVKVLDVLQKAKIDNITILTKLEDKK
ncbi:MAG: biopolymer transporter ExbD [Campylobacterota bacterium]|nr:biopolymer transporter ExbD [Campylobacterota bacterium]